MSRHYRRRYVWWSLALWGLLLLGLVTGCNANLSQASAAMMNEAEAGWQAAPVASYRIVVDVDRPDDLRRTEVTVYRGQISSAAVKYWDPRERRWDQAYPLNEEQAFPFTVPGLFDMVRGELRSSGRAEIRVGMGGSPAFPRRIVMGPVWQDGRPVSGTEATVTVRQFEPLSGDE